MPIASGHQMALRVTLCRAFAYGIETDDRLSVGLRRSHERRPRRIDVGFAAELGFRAVLMLNVWQGDLAKARQGLGGTS